MILHAGLTPGYAADDRLNIGIIGLAGMGSLDAKTFNAMGENADRVPDCPRSELKPLHHCCRRRRCILTTSGPPRSPGRSHHTKPPERSISPLPDSGAGNIRYPGPALAGRVSGDPCEQQQIFSSPVDIANNGLWEGHRDRDTGWCKRRDSARERQSPVVA